MFLGSLKLKIRQYEKKLFVSGSKKRLLIQKLIWYHVNAEFCIWNTFFEQNNWHTFSSVSPFFSTAVSIFITEDIFLFKRFRIHYFAACCDLLTFTQELAHHNEKISTKNENTSAGFSSLYTGNPGSVIVPPYSSSKITVFVWGQNTILKFLGNTK